MTQIYRELMYRRVELYQGDYVYYVTTKRKDCSTVSQQYNRER